MTTLKQKNMSIVSTVDYRIVGEDEILKEIYDKCQHIIDSNENPSLTLLLDSLGISYRGDAIEYNLQQ